jgi:FAD/FMN-containing dehydrogenase
MTTYRRLDVYRKLVALDRRYRLNQKRNLPQREAVIQDVEIPVERGAEFLRFFAAKVGMSPVWMCPLRPRSEGAWSLCPLQPGDVYVNFGFWGTVPLPADQADGYHNRLVEDEVARLDGHKSLYSTSFYGDDEFCRRYDGEAYRALKRAYDGEGRLLGLYEKCVSGR